MAKILIVDDSSIIRYRLRGILIKSGHQVVAEAENGIQAITRAQEYDPDIITMDITMPKMDGITALKKIRSINPKIKVIMLSAMGQRLIVLDAINSGASHFIVKPFEDFKVIQIINEVIDSENGLSEPVSNENEPAANEGSKNFINYKEDCYEIVFIADTYVVKIFRDMTTEELDSYSLILQDLINTPDLKIIFDFCDLEKLDRQFLKMISQIIDEVINKKGTYLLSSTSENFINYAKSLELIHLTEFVKAY
jgi:two-component system, chemotaxis family, chemotaxis protein CheY